MSMVRLWSNGHLATDPRDLKKKKSTHSPKKSLLPQFPNCFTSSWPIHKILINPKYLFAQKSWYNKALKLVDKYNLSLKPDCQILHHCLFISKHTITLLLPNSNKTTWLKYVYVCDLTSKHLTGLVLLLRQKRTYPYIRSDVRLIRL